MGYAYFISMMIIALSGLCIYDPNTVWNLTHYCALVSFATMLAAMLPLVLKMSALRFNEIHGKFMLWSVLTFYLEILAEVWYRVPLVRDFVADGLH
jgi:hypothetical protein